MLFKPGHGSSGGELHRKLADADPLQDTAATNDVTPVRLPVKDSNPEWHRLESPLFPLTPADPGSGQAPGPLEKRSVPR